MNRGMRIGMGCGGALFAALVASVLVSVAAGRGQVETTWQRSNGAPLGEPQRPWTDAPSSWARVEPTVAAVSAACEAEAEAQRVWARERRSPGSADLTSPPLSAELPRASCVGALDALYAAVPDAGLLVPTAALDAPAGETPDLTTVNFAGRFEARLAARDAAAGNWLDAGAHAAQALRLGRIFTHGGSLLSSMVGASINKRAVDWLESLPAETPAVFWSVVAPELKLDAGWPHPLHAALTAECRSTEDIFVRLADDPAGLGTEGASALAVTPLYSAEKTLWRYRAQCRELLASLDLPRGERGESTLPPLNAGFFRWIDNPIGRILLSIAEPSWGGMIDRSEEATAGRARLSARAQDAVVAALSNPSGLEAAPAIPGPAPAESPPPAP